MITLYSRRRWRLVLKGDTEAKISWLKKLLTQYKNSEYVDDAQVRNCYRLRCKR